MLNLSNGPRRCEYHRSFDGPACSAPATHESAMCKAPGVPAIVACPRHAHAVDHNHLQLGAPKTMRKLAVAA